MQPIDRNQAGSTGSERTSGMPGGASRLSTKDTVFIGIFAALMAICSWITIPMAVPFTMQTFAVFLACLVLGGRRGTLSVLVFIILGAVGVPVFHGFTGGPGVLLGSTGGYIIGFIGTALVLWGMERWYHGSKARAAAAMLFGLLVCYALGTAWFMVVYARANGPVSLMTVLGWCVLPFIVPDLIKIGLAMAVAPVIRQAAML